MKNLAIPALCIAGPLGAHSATAPTPEAVAEVRGHAVFREERRAPVLPDLMEASDLPLGLGGVGVDEGDTVEGGAVLEFRGVILKRGLEERRVDDVDPERHAVSLEGVFEACVPSADRYKVFPTLECGVACPW